MTPVNLAGKSDEELIELARAAATSGAPYLPSLVFELAKRLKEKIK